jgi:hypothetical protein
VTFDQLKAADVIEAVDPNRPSFREPVWGEGVMPPMRPYPIRPCNIRVLEVQIDSSQDGQLHDLRRRVQAAKEHLRVKDSSRGLDDVETKRLYERVQTLLDRPIGKPPRWEDIESRYQRSLTYNLDAVTSEDCERAYELEEEAVEHLMAAFRACTAVDEPMYFFDWQHPCYLFYPHALHGLRPPGPYTLWDDYYILLAKDVRFGVYSNLWYQVGVFGDALVSVVERDVPQLFRNCIRRNGVVLERAFNADQPPMLENEGRDGKDHGGGE